VAWIRPPAGLTNAVAVAGGYYNGMALKSDGTVVTWGFNNHGETNVPRSDEHRGHCGRFLPLPAFRMDGAIFAWGDNSSGQTNVPAGLTNVVGIASGYYHNLALMNDDVPILTQQPCSQTAYVGMQVEFATRAAGAFRWIINGNSTEPILTARQMPR